jgi:hypothetical protein
VSAEQAARARLLRLQQEIRVELEALDKLRDKLERFSGAEGATVPEEARWAMLAVSLHGYYCAVESSLMRIARTVDGDTPVGDEWHRDLLLCMSMPLGDIRGPVLSEESRAFLGKLLGFRHFFRHAYAVEFDGALLLDHASRVATAHPRLAQELRLFVAQLLD